MEPLVTSPKRSGPASGAGRRRQIPAGGAGTPPPRALRGAADPAAGAAGQPPAPLPPRQRAALTLRYVHDLDDHAIAAALGCRRGTVRSLLSRGLAALRSEEGTR